MKNMEKLYKKICGDEDRKMHGEGRGAKRTNYYYYEPWLQQKLWQLTSIKYRNQ